MRNEIVNTNNKLMTTKELATMLNTTKDVILSNGKKCFPNKVILHGKPTVWNQAEITIILDYMKSHTSNNRSVEFNSTVKNTETELTPALRIRKAMLEMQSAYEDELEILRQKNEAQQNQLLEQKPKVEFYDDVTGSNDTIDMGEVAKVLNIKNVGRNKLFEILRNKNILQQNNQPYQKFIDIGYFRVIESKYSLPNGDIKINLKTVVF